MNLAIRLGLIVCVTLVSACGGGKSVTNSTYNPNLIGGNPDELQADQNNTDRSTIWDIFGNSANQEVTVKVNKYLWAASLETLSFLPIEDADPFTGLIVMGYGTPPGGGRAYRATIHIKDPALAARSLNISLQTRSGPAPRATTRAVEDAILSRARQIRVADDKL
jgi:hypothetical protein